MRKTLVRLAAVAAGGGLAVLGTAVAFADHDADTAVTTLPSSTVDHETQQISPVSGPRDCGVVRAKLDDMGAVPAEWTVDDGDAAFHVAGDAAKHYTVTVSGTVDGSPAALHAIHLGVGLNASSYYFDPPVTFATNLTAENVRVGGLADVSHVWFCYGEGEQPDGSPSPSPTETATSPPPTTPAATPTSPATSPDTTPSTGPSGSPSVAPGEDPGDNSGLPSTGSRVGTLVGLGIVLLLAGGATVTMIALRRRRGLSNLLNG